ncbi:MAG: LysR family transcriptional regulator [Myxococcota bacterium]
MNWSDLVYAVALGHEGTLSAAARALRVDHATVSRRVARLEEELGVSLFDKTPDGYRATSAGRVLLEAGRDVETRLATMRLDLEPHAALTSGPVRITALETFFSVVLEPRLPEFRDRFPDIELTLDDSATYRDLSRKEAEIAVRSPKPKQPNLICRRAFKVACALYASRAYVERFGLPRPLADTRGHFVVRYAKELAWVPEEKWIDKNLRGFRAPARACSMGQMRELVSAGVGFGFIECLSGDRDPNLLRVPDSPVTRYTYWLVVHEEAHKAPRVQATLQFLVELCREFGPAYQGQPL